MRPARDTPSPAARRPRRRAPSRGPAARPARRQASSGDRGVGEHPHDPPRQQRRTEERMQARRAGTAGPADRTTRSRDRAPRRGRSAPRPAASAPRRWAGCRAAWSRPRRAAPPGEQEQPTRQRGLARVAGGTVTVTARVGYAADGPTSARCVPKRSRPPSATPRAAFEQPVEFVPGETRVPVSRQGDRRPGAVGARRRGARRLAHRGPLRPIASAAASATSAGAEHVALTGSGSQANLLAVAAAGSHLHERPLRRGDEVITPAVGFPTTVAPLYQLGLVPVYVDVELGTYNPSAGGDRGARSDRARARSSPPTPSATRSTRRPCAQLCDEHGLVLIEDCCDALGSRIGGRPVGHVRRGRHLLLLSRPPHDDRRGRRRGLRRRRLGARARLAARVGARLLVPARPRRRLRAALRGPLRRPARGLRPQVRLLARGLQLQDHRHAGGARRRPARAAGGVRRAPARQLRPPAARARSRSRTASCCRARCRGAEPLWFGFPFTLRDGGAAERRGAAAASAARGGSTPGCCWRAT